MNNLPESERRLKLALEAGQMGVWEWNPKTGAAFLDEQCLKLFGLTPETFDQTGPSVFAVVHPADRNSLFRLLQHTFENQLSCEMEFRVAHQDGSVRWLRGAGQADCHPMDENARLVVICGDISERKRLESELTRAQRLTLAGEMAAELAHEIKNPLAGIKGAIDVLIERRAGDDPERDVLKNVSYEIVRIERLVSSMLDRARPKSLKLERQSLTETISRAIALARSEAASNHRRARRITINSELPAEPLIFLHDPDQIEDAVLNLIINALEAIEKENGQIIVSLNVARAGGERSVVIEVADNGRGIAEADLQKIFAPFYSMKENGTGLGLAAVRRIASAHGGNCEVSSIPGRGSTFRIYLPSMSGQ